MALERYKHTERTGCLKVRDLWRVQQFPQRSQRSRSYSGIGWVRIDTLIEVKKKELLCILTILIMDPTTTISIIFIMRILDYLRDRQSQVIGMVNAGPKFGLWKRIHDMVCGRSEILHTAAWST